MTDLVEFLTARYSEDEVVARTAGGSRPSGSRWTADLPADCRARGTVADGHGDIVIYECYAGEQHATHIARHDPARVLADIAGKRRILRDYELIMVNAKAETDDVKARLYHFAAQALSMGLSALAEPYRAHPDFDPAWGRVDG